MYRENTIKTGFLKKRLAKKENTMSLALQGIKGIIAITINLSLGSGRTLKARMAETLQPNPRIRGMTLCP
jgi:hypothetical protein